MPRLIRELNDLVFDRGAITRADTFDCSGVQRRLGQILPNRIVYLGRRVADIAVDLLLLDAIGGKGKRYRNLVAGLRFERLPIDSSAVQPWRRARFQSAHRKPRPLERFG